VSEAAQGIDIGHSPTGEVVAQLLIHSIKDF
jgi:hypothetical protein